MQNIYKYDVAISFANEDRNAALALALALEIKGFESPKIYYYHDQPSATASKKLRPTLHKIFSIESKYIVVLLSKKYLKKGPHSAVQTELNVIYKRIEENSDTINVILVKLQPTLRLLDYPILQELTWVNWNFDPKGIAHIVKENFGTINPIQDKAEFFSKNLEQRAFINQANKASVAKNQQNNLSIKL